MWDHAFGMIRGTSDLGKDKKHKGKVHLVPRTPVDYKQLILDNFEESFECHPLKKMIGQVKKITRQLQLPFFLAELHKICGYRVGDSHVYMRKREEVPWNWFVRTFCKSVEVPAPSPELVAFCNYWLVRHNYGTYCTDHPIWSWTHFFVLRFDISSELVKMRTETPFDFHDPPIQIPTTKGMRNSTRIFPAFVVPDDPAPIDELRTRLEINRRLGCRLKRKSDEWEYAANKRHRSEAARPYNERVLLTKPLVYRHNPQDFTVGS